MRVANHGFDQWQVTIIDRLLQRAFIQDFRRVFTLCMRRSDDESH
ncbi:MAG: hypothetical protein AAF641_05320 [Pseudomonadota bacterium]